MTKILKLTAATLCTIAGLQLSVHAQPPATDKTVTRPEPTRDKTPRTAESKQPVDRMDRTQGVGDARIHLQTWAWAKGRNVVDAAGTTVGEVEDLVIDRGSGRIEYVVIDTNDAFGLSGKTVEIPFRNFGKASDDRFTLFNPIASYSGSQEFDSKNWREHTRRDMGWMESNVDRTSDQNKDAYNQAATDDAVADTSDRTKVQNNHTDTRKDPYNQNDRDKDATDHVDVHDAVATSLAIAAAMDPYPDAFAKGGAHRVDGVVQSVNRVSSPQYGEQIEVVITQPDGTTKRLALGPSWYVSGGSAAPMRGDKLIAEVCAEPKSADAPHVARWVDLNGRKVDLRDGQGKAMWAPADAKPGSPTIANSLSVSPFILATELNGANLRCQTSACGEITDLIVECESGRIALVSIDPDDNFLGIGDTSRLVPWSVLSVAADRTVGVDATRDMIVASIATPDDLSKLAAGDGLTSIYKAYGVNRPDFSANTTRSHRQMRSQTSAGEQSTANGFARTNGTLDRKIWGPNGKMLTTADRSAERTLTGKVESVSDAKLSNELGMAHVLVLRMNSGSEMIILGPAGCLEHETLSSEKSGDVTVEAWPATIDGKKYWVARSIKDNAHTLVMWDDKGIPTWDIR